MRPSGCQRSAKPNLSDIPATVCRPWRVLGVSGSRRLNRTQAAFFPAVTPKRFFPFAL